MDGDAGEGSGVDGGGGEGGGVDGDGGKGGVLDCEGGGRLGRGEQGNAGADDSGDPTR